MTEILTHNQKQKVFRKKYLMEIWRGLLLIPTISIDLHIIFNNFNRTYWNDRDINFIHQIYLYIYIRSHAPNIIYTTNWFHTTVMIPAKVEENLCPICNMKTRNSKHNSSPRDLVTTSTFNKIYNIVPFIRTLRTVGCIARIILITDSIATSKLNNGNMSSFIGYCGVQVVNVGIISGKRSFLLCSRNIILHDFLKNKRNIIDRILIADLYDTIFQGDPFTEDLDRNKLGISEETQAFDQQQASAIKKILGNLLGNEISKLKVLNAGTLIGGYDVIFSFLLSFVNYFFSFSKEEREIHEKTVDIIDQVYVNILLHCNISKLAIRKYKINDLYITCWNIFNWKFNKQFSNFTVDNKVYPLVIHLFDRIGETVISLLQTCPQTFPQADSYVRESHLSANYIAQIKSQRYQI